MTDAKKDPVENMAKVMETFEMLMDLKNKIQCTAIKNPTKVNCVKVFNEIAIDLFLYSKNNSKNTLANNILYQTKEASLTDINSPKIAVNPQINTIKWRLK